MKPGEPFDKLRFLAMAIVTTAVALGMACVFGYTRYRGQWVFIAPGYLMLPVLAAVYLTIVFGRCRVPMVAGGFSVLMASLFFWGQFPAALGFDFGFEHAVSPTNVLQYTRWRWKNEVFVPASAGEDWLQRHPKPSEPDLHWFVDVLRFFLVAAAFGALAAWRSNWLFCERCQRWTSREKRNIQFKAGGGILALLQADKLDELNPVVFGGSASDGHAWMIIEYCRSAPVGSTRCPTNLSINDPGTWVPNKRVISADGKSSRYVTATKSGQLLERHPLTDRQIRALMPFFSALRSIALIPPSDVRSDTENSTAPH